MLESKRSNVLHRKVDFMSEARMREEMERLYRGASEHLMAVRNILGEYFSASGGGTSLRGSRTYY
ncbi:MAG: hypothetical protein JWO19_5869 [Bryobacterales bacterium]|nr:hypothetical protein [Bryobacterales bacterium]